MKNVVMVSVPLDEFQALITRSVNACLRHNETLKKIESIVKDREDKPVLATIKKSAEKLGVSQSTVRWYIESGLLETVRVGSTGRGVRIEVKKLEELAEHLKKKKTKQY